MFEKIVSMFRYLKSAVPFRLVPALIATLVLIGLLLTPVPAGWMQGMATGGHLSDDHRGDHPQGHAHRRDGIDGDCHRVAVPGDLQFVQGAITDALSSFANPLIWLIVVAVLISRGLKKTGLGNRIGLLFIALMGKRTIGIGYGLAICELVLAPFTPSNTARGGGIVHPIMKSIANAFESDPAKGTQGKVGTYLALVNYHSNPITSAMFLTATAPNPLVVDLVAKATGQSLPELDKLGAVHAAARAAVSAVDAAGGLSAVATRTQGHAQCRGVRARRDGPHGAAVGQGAGDARDLRRDAAAVGECAADAVRPGFHAGPDRGGFSRFVRPDHHGDHRLG
jgi:di/tricarboxylate transporter